MREVPIKLEKNGQQLLSKTMEKKQLELGQIVSPGSGRKKAL